MPKIKIEHDKWKLFMNENAKLFGFWIFGVAILMLFRIFLIYNFKDKITDTDTLDLINIFLKGFKFDSQIVIISMAVPILLNLTLFTKNRSKIIERTRVIFSYLFLFVTLFLCSITPTYFKEYDEQFNHFLFLGLNDDLSAVFKTIFLEYHPLLVFFTFLILFFLSIKIMQIIYRYFKAPSILITNNRYIRVIIYMIILIFIIYNGRGSIIGKPVMKKWSYVSRDAFLNKTVINSIKSLIYAYKDYKQLNSINKINIFEKETIKSLPKNYTDRVVKQDRNISVNHIILVVMESYDSWPLQDKYKDLHISDNLRDISSKGLYFKKSLPISHSTMNSLGAIISGLPYSGVNISIKKSYGGSEKSSFFYNMNKLGYKSSFFYGGLGSWQNIDNFVKNQGVNRSFMAVDIQNGVKRGIWGVEDTELFDLVQKTISKEKKSFSIIMTTSYHGPFDIDVWNYGYPYKSQDEYPEKYKKIGKITMTNKMIGHLWFGDYAIGRFVKKFQKDNPNTIFIFTGDHFGRRYFTSKPNPYENSSVPIIFYGKPIHSLKIDTNITANHMDIMPSIIDMVAPKGFKYKSFGQSLFNKRDITVGYKCAIDQKNIYRFIGKNRYEIYNFKKNSTIYMDKKEFLKEHKNIYDYYNIYHALSWNETTKGQ